MKYFLPIKALMQQMILQAVQYISFAILMILGDLVFMWLACNYKIKNPRGSYKPNKSLASPTTGERKSTAEEQQKAQTGSSQ